MQLGGRPAIFGILNVTPDSFSDGGRFASFDRAVARALEMLADGADAIDVGGESTRPGADEVSAEVEQSRVVPVVTELARRGVVVSIDTRKAVVARAALDAGAAIVNDVSGMAHSKAMARLVAERNAGVVIMHSRGTPATMNSLASYASVVDDVLFELRTAIESALRSGIQRGSIAIDPGIGFAKTPEQSLEVLAHLDRFLPLGFPLFIGPSRKSFIGHVTKKPPNARLWGTAAAVAIAVAKGASMIRVHDVAEIRDVVLVAQAVAAAATKPREDAPR